MARINQKSKIQWGPAVIGTLVFYVLQVYLPIEIISPRVEAIPAWVFRFASWWAFAYVCGLIWVKGRFPVYYALGTGLAFLLAVFLKYNGYWESPFQHLLSLFGGPAIVVVGVAAGLGLKFQPRKSP